MTPDLREQLQSTLGGSYTLERELGGGGMSRVFLAADARLGRRVVVKVLHPDLAAGISAQRFEREIRLAAQLQHPHVVPLLSAGALDGLPYYTMPYVEGESLRHRLSRDGALPIADALRLVREVADALAYAHRLGVVHRDLKPENVLLSAGHAVVADFGVAKALTAAVGGDQRAERATDSSTVGLTSVGLALGTPAYMAPEQAAGDPATDHRADLYALGLIAYEMLAGTHPFANRTPQAMLVAQLTESPASLVERRPEVTQAVAALVMGLLAKSPADRPQNAEGVVAALDAVATPGHETASLPNASPPLRRRQFRWLVASLAGGALVTMVFAAVARFSSSRAGAEQPVLAVLPFENLGPAADAYFADGLTEEMRGRLAGVTGLRVISGASARQYRGTTKGPREIARELGATHLLTGSVRWERGSSGGRVRVSPELIRASDETSIWAEPYDGPIESVFELQTRVAERVASALDVRLLAHEHQAVAARPTQNLAAYDAYLRGLANTTQPGRYSAPLRRIAIAEFERAVALDSTFAVAHAALARAYLVADFFNGDSALLRKARASVQRAVVLAPQLLDSQLSRADYMVAAGDVEGALQVADSAARQARENPAVLLRLGSIQSAVGRFTDAIATYEHAARLDPRSPDAPAGLAGLYELLGRTEDAIRTREREIALSPENVLTYAVQATAYLVWRADTANARRTLERVSPSLGTAVLARLPDTNVGQGMWSAVLPSAVLRAKDTLTFQGYVAGGDTTPELYHFMKLRHFARAGRLDRARAHADSIIALLDAALGPNAELSERKLWRFNRLGILAEAYAYRGRRADAARVIDRYAAEASRFSDIFYRRFALGTVPYLDVLAGRRDSAVVRLTRLLEEPHGFFLSRALLRADASWAPLRGHPGFERLIADMDRVDQSR